MSSPRIPDCPLARTVGVIGNWWTLEILHEVFDGHTTFDAIQRNLTTEPAVLQERLVALITKGLLEPAGLLEYRLTELGRSLRPVILVLAAWGNHRLASADRSLVLVDRETGVAVDPVVVDQATGRRVDTEEFLFARGPKASELISARYPAIPG